jgi:DeoR family ulaG and ulaABCDEF operon transcriptional repressor
MPVAAMLWEKSRIHVVVAGGELHREPEILFSGAYAKTAHYASKFFLGAQAFGPEGIMESNPMLVDAIFQLLESADEIIVLCDSSKFDLRARLVACPINRVGTVVTDDGIADASKEMLNTQGVNLLVAKT